MRGILSLLLTPLLWPRHRRIVSFRGRLLDQVNVSRKKKQMRRLGRTRLLDKLAAGHSKSMAKRRHCDHKGFDKRSKLIRRKTGVSSVAENCHMFPARKYDAHVARELVEGWLRSSGHRNNLLNPNFRRTGIGIVVRKDHVYATQIFTE